MDHIEWLRAAMGRIWASPHIIDDFAALCACGGRFSGTDSEVRARELLAKRMTDATGRAVQRGACTTGVGRAAQPGPSFPTGAVSIAGCWIVAGSAW